MRDEQVLVLEGAAGEDKQPAPIGAWSRTLGLPPQALESFLAAVGEHAARQREPAAAA